MAWVGAMNDIRGMPSWALTLQYREMDFSVTKYGCKKCKLADKNIKMAALD